MRLVGMNAHDDLSALRVLLVEDSPDDAELLARALRTMPREVRTLRVDNERDLRTALDAFDPHLVLSDHTMPGFSGQEALRLVRELAPSRPFIFVSGTIGEEAAIEALRRGAADYVFKDNLRRLTTAVENALQKFAERAEHERMQQALRESEERFRAIVESTEDWVWEMDLGGRLTYTNGSVENLLGYSPAELEGRNILEFIVSPSREELDANINRHVSERSGWRRAVLQWRHRDGSTRMIESTGQPLLGQHGTVIGFRGIDRDITLQLQQQAKIRELARFHAVLSALGTAILRARAVPALLDMACRLAVEQGQFAAAVVAMPDERGHLVPRYSFGDAAAIALFESLGPADPTSEADLQRPMARAFATRRIAAVPDYAEADLSPERRLAAAQAGVVAQVAVPVGSPPWAVMALFAGSPRNFDAEECALLERMGADLDYARDFIAKGERLEYLAFRSTLTGLPNRAALQVEWQGWLGASRQAVGLVSVDRFLQISEVRGRDFADRLLTAIGSRLVEEAPAGTFLAHTNADAFMFAWPAQATLEDSVAHAERWLSASAASPVVIGGEQIHFALRGGLTIAPDHGRDFDTVERNAHAAQAEAVRRDVPMSGYSEEMSQRAARRVLLERELRVALAEKQFELFLQPKFETRSRRMVGAEALLRWRHPEHGLVSPAEFVPLLEDTGLIIPTGHWVMSTAVELLRAWRRRDLPDYRIAVNVSARELREQGFADACRALLEADFEHGLDIEVTESLLMEDMAQNVRVLSKLRELGCRIAIDDFGTGYSSLNYLSRLPLDVLKIDRTFTSQIAASPDTLALVTNIIGLAHSLDLKVVAEGVEEEEQEKLMRLLRCDELQGYLLGRPVPVAEFERLYLN
jgi:PAS domain S-box-containing protein